MHSARSITLFGSAFTFGLILANCMIENPNHCWNADGNATCEKLYPGKKVFCTKGEAECPEAYLGCVKDEPALDSECYSPCGNKQTYAEDHSCLTMVGDDGSTESDGAELGTSDTDAGSDTSDTGGGCAGNEECAGALEICQSGNCVEVECVEDGDCPGLCDVETHTCVPCTSQDECPGEAGCNTVAGECLPADKVWHVGPGREFGTIQEAVTHLHNNGRVGTIVVHSQDGGYHETITVEASDIVAIRAAADGMSPRLLSADADDDCVDDADYTFYVKGRLFLHRITASGSGGARLVEGGTLEITKASITADSCRAVHCNGASVNIINSMLTAHTLEPLRLAGECAITVRATTVSSGANEPFECKNSTSVLSGSSIQKSLFYSTTDISNGCDNDPDLKVDPSVVETHESARFEDILDGDLHLTDSAPLEQLEAAPPDPHQGDPLYEIDGDPRDPDYVGADVPVPE